MGLRSGGKRLWWLVLVAVLAAGSGIVLAEATRYVTDQLSVTLRTGKGPQYSIVKVLSSGTRVRVLETDGESGYSRVRAGDGSEGWMLSRYLMDEPAARDRLPEILERDRRLEEENARLEETLAALEEEGAGAEGHAEALEKELDDLHGEVLILRRKAAKRWFLWGAGVVLLSLLIGFGLGRRRHRY